MNDDPAILEISNATLKAIEKGSPAAQHRVHLTAFGASVLAFLAGFGICWLVFVR
jgi:hypothetical protein